jgi:predicted nucleic acid-binding protein
VTVYAESSAILAWLLNEPESDVVRGVLGGADRVVASTLTEVECARALTRGAVTGRLSPADELAALRLLDRGVCSWVTLGVVESVERRAMQRFPVEPVRTLDALHLATALEFREAGLSVTMLSLDDRVRSNAEALGLPVAP